MARRGRPPLEDVHRGASGQVSHRQGARPADPVTADQPHRRPFLRLIGEDGAGDWRCAFALGRLRMIGECEERMPAKEVRRLLFSGHAHAPHGPFGVSERLFFAGMKCAETVGRERFVRATPKDKPQAIAFAVARGIDLSARELSNEEAALYVARYEEMNAALLAAPCPPDARRALRILRGKAKALGAKADDLVRILRGLGALMNPALSGAVKRAVELVVLDDRDPDLDALPMVRAGLAALADHYFGAEREDSRAIVGVTSERPTWPHDERVIEVLYPDGQGGVRTAHATPLHEREAAREEAHWKRRHRSHAGG